MSLINLELPLSSIERIVKSLETIAANSDRIVNYLMPELPDPIYNKQRPHVHEPDYVLIRQVEDLNVERAKRGQPNLSFEEAVASLRHEI